MPRLPREFASVLLALGISVGGSKAAEATQNLSDDATDPSAEGVDDLSIGNTELMEEAAKTALSVPEATAIPVGNNNSLEKQFRAVGLTLENRASPPRELELTVDGKSATGFVTVADEEGDTDETTIAPAETENRVNLEPSQQGEMAPLTPVDANVCQQFGMPERFWLSAGELVIPATMAVNIREDASLTAPLVADHSSYWNVPLVVADVGNGWLGIFGKNSEAVNPQVYVASWVVPAVEKQGSLCAFFTDTDNVQSPVPENFVLQGEGDGNGLPEIRADVLTRFSEFQIAPIQQAATDLNIGIDRIVLLGEELVGTRRVIENGVEQHIVVARWQEGLGVSQWVVEPETPAVDQNPTPPNPNGEDSLQIRETESANTPAAVGAPDAPLVNGEGGPTEAAPRTEETIVPVATATELAVATGAPLAPNGAIFISDYIPATPEMRAANSTWASNTQAGYERIFQAYGEQPLLNLDSFQLPMHNGEPLPHWGFYDKGESEQLGLGMADFAFVGVIFDQKSNLIGDNQFSVAVQTQVGNIPLLIENGYATDTLVGGQPLKLNYISLHQNTIQSDVERLTEQELQQKLIPGRVVILLGRSGGYSNQGTGSMWSDALVAAENTALTNTNDLLNRIANGEDIPQDLDYSLLGSPFLFGMAVQE